MDRLDRVHLYLKLMTASGFLLFGLAVVGEVLGWWNDWGEILATLGGILGILGLPLSLLWGASKTEVREAREELHSLGVKAGEHTRLLSEQGGLLREQGASLREIAQVLREHTSLLRTQGETLAAIRDRL